MAKRKDWWQLSTPYKMRLLRHHITPWGHDHEAQDLTEARGHLYTPEHGEYPYEVRLDNGNGRFLTIVNIGGLDS